MEMKIVNTVFSISEFEEEAQWLSDMHSQGWRLEGISGNKYKFEKCESEEWVYQLDFQHKNIKKDNYIQLFTDYGWEYIMQHNNWFYFKKKKIRLTPMFLFSATKNLKLLCANDYYWANSLSLQAYF